MTSFTLDSRALNVKQFKAEAKKHAQAHGMTHVAALDDLVRQGSSEHDTWSRFLRYETAQLLPNSRVQTRLKNGILLEIRIEGFAADLSDFASAQAMTAMSLSGEAGETEFRLICMVEKAQGPASTHRLLSELFDVSKDRAPLRERLAPLAQALKTEVTGALDIWQRLKPGHIRQGRSAGAEAEILKAEAMIADIRQHHGGREAVWAAKATLAMHDAVPVAWLTLLQSGEYQRKEFIRIVECGLAACDFAYGPDLNLVPFSDPHFVVAMDTFVTLKQYEAALLEDMGSVKHAEVVRYSVLEKLTKGQVPQHILMQSKTLRPQP